MGIFSTIKGLLGRSISLEFSVVAVISTILLVYAVPVYTDYMVRTKVLEAIQLSTPLKNHVHSYVSTNGRLPEPADLSNQNLFVSHPASGILSIALFGKGKIGIVTKNLGGDAEYGQQIWLTPKISSGSLRWQCKPGLEQPPFPTKYLPRSCS